MVVCLYRVVEPEKGTIIVLQSDAINICKPARICEGLFNSMREDYPLSRVIRNPPQLVIQASGLLLSVAISDFRYNQKLEVRW